MSIALLVGITQPALADQKDPRLDALFKGLKTSYAAAQSSRIETEIWKIWTTHNNQMIADEMQRGISFIQAGKLANAEDLFSALILADPEFAEAWNKRATIRFYRGNIDGSLADISEVMRLEPRHFGALSGLGMIHVQAGDLAAALTSYQAAQQINPNLENIDSLIKQLMLTLRGRAT
ncbi:MAG: tetratricopeptide repeat protein [Opitutae bacterium]